MTAFVPDPESLAATPFSFEGVEFRIAPLGGHHNPDHLVIVKPRAVVDAYVQLLSGMERPRLVELGIAYGGSVGLVALAAQPARMVALDIAPGPIPRLDGILEECGLADRVSLHWGVDQADKSRLTAIVDEAFGQEPLDLVIDDASHLYGPTVATFEVLFPRLRPGARYLVEDWSCDHGIRTLLAAAYADRDSPFHGWSELAMAGQLSSHNAGEPGQTEIAVNALRRQLGQSSEPPAIPLSRLGLDMVHGVAEPHSGIGSVHIIPFWIEVERDDVPLGDDYALASACPDHFSMLRPAP